MAVGVRSISTLVSNKFTGGSRKGGNYVRFAILAFFFGFSDSASG